MAIVLNGKEFAKQCEEEFKLEVESVVKELGYIPKLATILVGDDMASVTYVNMKARACERVGLASQIVKLPSQTTTEELLSIINELNNDKMVAGILLQHPVPKHIDERLCFDSINVDKDVDGVNSESFGRMVMDRDAFISATPYGIIRLLKHYKIDLSGKHAVVVGRSSILGKPMAMLLLKENCTVTICHSRTKNLVDTIKSADIVVGALGKSEYIRAEWIKPGAVLVDAGYNEGNVGDIDLSHAIGSCYAYTPVPGGVGPMTINSLILQTIESAKKMASRN